MGSVRRNAVSTQAAAAVADDGVRAEWGAATHRSSSLFAQYFNSFVIGPTVWCRGLSLRVPDTKRSRIMPQCAVSSCSNTHRKTKGGCIRYHRFPGDERTRSRWLLACGRHVQNCATARVCSLHFSPECYEKDVQHELLGLPTRCRLRKGAVPDRQLPPSAVVVSSKYIDKAKPFLRPHDNNTALVRSRALVKKMVEELERNDGGGIAVLLAVGLVPASRRINGGLPQDSSNKMEDVVHEGCGDAAQQPSSPGHADQRASEDRRANNNNNNSLNAKTSSSADEQDEDEEDDDEESSNLVANITNEKRKNETDDDDSLAVFKKIKGDIHLQECYLRNKVLNDYADAFDAGNANDMDVHVDQLLVEIQNLEDIAKEKEREWNNVIHMKKMKEELLLRVQRQKQVYLLSNGLEISENHDVFGGGGGNRSLMSQQQQQQQKRRLNNNNNNNNNKSMELLVNGIDGNKGRKGPVRDVQSIIADYRQQHPESVPRRGRRIRNVNGSSGTITNDAKTTTGNNNGGVMNFSSLALGSGARVRQHNVDSSTDVTLFLASGGGDNSAVKQENSTTSSRTTFSPTLARLLTAPDKTTCNNAQQSNHHHNNSNNKSSNVSISDILNTNKGRSEITITPVGNDYIDDGHQQVQHLKRGKNQMEDETEDSVDRLVIDESNDLTDSRTDNNSDDGAGDEVPQCQGCNQKAAQFVCAGCSNQWYCSRECQVNAWDEHSEMCSG